MLEQRPLAHALDDADLPVVVVLVAEQAPEAIPHRDDVEKAVFEHERLDRPQPIERRSAATLVVIDPHHQRQLDARRAVKRAGVRDRRSRGSSCRGRARAPARARQAPPTACVPPDPRRRARRTWRSSRRAPDARARSRHSTASSARSRFRRSGDCRKRFSAISACPRCSCAVLTVRVQPHASLPEQIFFAGMKSQEFVAQILQHDRNRSRHRR